ncbi:MAG: hypothetical protein AAGI23_15460 [Bacteroidota bacterium]
MSLNENTNLKRATLALLVQMSHSDAQLSNIEEQYIIYVAKELNLPLSEVEAIQAQPENYDLKPPQSEQERMMILYYLLFTMRVDGKIEKSEEDMLYKAALRLGFNHQMISDLIAVAKNHPKGNLPPDSLLREIKKYMN